MTEEKERLIPLSSNDNLENDDNYKIYKTSLKEALNNPKLNNIAITGKYGSGKSSIIDTYIKNDEIKLTIKQKFFNFITNLKICKTKEEREKEIDNRNNLIRKKKYLRVSFATFVKNKDRNNDKNKDDINNEKKSKENVYINIINQIVYQINGSRIPLTNFKIKRPLSWLNKFVVISFFILLIEFLFKPLNLTLFLSSSVILIINIIILDLLFSFGILIFNWVLSNFEPLKLSINIKNIQADLNKDNDDLFEKHADEIIYLFNKYEKYGTALIIEDLDRFDDVLIFEKLKELNTKLNNSSKKHWTFVYLIKDELFINPNDRVKFFDLIIPVIPFITTNNSYDKLKEYFSEKKFDKNLLFYLSNFIDDFRMMLNIHNDYYVYENLIHTKNHNELLALMTYKNLAPFDFDNVQNGKGIIGQIVEKSKDNINEQISNLESEKGHLIDKKYGKNESEVLLSWSNSNNGYGRYAYNDNNSTFSIDNENDTQNIINGNLQIFDGVQYINYNEFKKSDKDYIGKLNELEKFKERLKKYDDDIKK